MGCGRSVRVVHVYRVVAVASSACMVYRSSFRQWVTRTFGGRQLIHLCGPGEMAGDGDLGGVVLAGSGVGDDVVGRPFVVGGVLHRVQLEWGVDWFRQWGLFLGFHVGRHFCFDQVLRAPGFRGPYLGGCRCCVLEEGGCVVV